MATTTQSKMMSREVIVVAVLMMVLLSSSMVQSRYLPTRGADDRILRLRQLLKDLMENDLDPIMEHPAAPNGQYDPRLYKRAAPPVQWDAVGAQFAGN
uniref:Uncharacterized protein n=1 Tax=Rhodnius prolixus TaxID=13249 RepID=T1H8P3_RHOPR